eukprot:Nitzschia sp. Nitz4//scaffold51_size120721//68107//68512//NITZ4_003734-RA/size120721-snap-gene-0.21-mRNA-1//1//CDS//3329553883//356//frame0
MDDLRNAHKTSTGTGTFLDTATNTTTFTMAGNPIYALLWLILLFFIAWPIAGLCCGLWIILQPFEACFPVIKDCNDFLERFVTWPRDCGAAIFSCSTSCPQP